jgi:putative tryptophan/tyrosine transport system substrate-binding protein
MRRREFIAPFGASVTWRFAALAQQQAGRPYRLGYLGAPRSDAVVPVFLEAMRRPGFIEGQNLTVDYRAYAKHIDKLSEWAAELIGDLAIRAAQEATKTIPILAITDDMVGSDW